MISLTCGISKKEKKQAPIYREQIVGCQRQVWKVNKMSERVSFFKILFTYF